MFSMTSLMWWALDLTLVVGVLIVVERIAFLCCTPLADELELRKAIGRWRATERWPRDSAELLGWFKPILEAAPDDLDEQFRRTTAEFNRASRFRSGSTATRETAMSLGLWGTFASFLYGSRSKDVTAMIAVGVGSSIYGLTTAIFLYVAYALLCGRANAVRRQMALVAEHMGARLMDPARYQSPQQGTDAESEKPRTRRQLTTVRRKTVALKSAEAPVNLSREMVNSVALAQATAQ